MNATVPAIRGMLCAIAEVPGRAGPPCLVAEGGLWWVVPYEDASGALEAMRAAMRHIRRRYYGWH